jgi:hypothetical protein
MSDILKKLENGNFFSSQYLSAGNLNAGRKFKFEQKDIYDIKKEWIKYGKNYMKDYPNIGLGPKKHGQKLVVGNTTIYQPQDLHGHELLALTHTKDKIIQYIKENYGDGYKIEYFHGQI